MNVVEGRRLYLPLKIFAHAHQLARDRRSQFPYAWFHANGPPIKIADDWVVRCSNHHSALVDQDTYLPLTRVLRRLLFDVKYRLDQLSAHELNWPSIAFKYVRYAARTGSEYNRANSNRFGNLESWINDY